MIPNHRWLSNFVHLIKQQNQIFIKGHIYILHEHSILKNKQQLGTLQYMLLAIVSQLFTTYFSTCIKLPLEKKPTELILTKISGFQKIFLKLKFSLVTIKHWYLQLLKTALVVITQLTDCFPLLEAKFSKGSLRSSKHFLSLAAQVPVKSTGLRTFKSQQIFICPLNQSFTIIKKEESMKNHCH